MEEVNTKLFDKHYDIETYLDSEATPAKSNIQMYKNSKKKTKLGEINFQKIDGRAYSMKLSYAIDLA